MKGVSAPLAALVTLMLLAMMTGPGCDQKPLPAGAVIFDQAGIALAPGPNWKQVREGALGSSDLGTLCLPLLQGEGENQGAVIQVFCAATSDKMKPAKRSEIIRKQLEARPAILLATLKQEDFDGQRASGVQLHFNEKAETATRKFLLRTDLYIVRNQRGQSVVLSYVRPAERDSKAVTEMIRETLTVQ